MITLKNLGEATSIQVFNQVKEHLLKQGQRSVSGSNCMYRGDNGLKCAAGCLIADDEHDPIMEINTWVGALNKLEGIGKVYPGMYHHTKLIRELQAMHDGKSPFKWEAELAKIEAGVLSGEYDQ